VVSVLVELVVLLELLVLLVSLVADTLLELLSEEDVELVGGGPGGRLFCPFRPAINSCRKASSLESTLAEEMLLLEEVGVADVTEVALVAELSRSTPNEARISLSAPIKPPPLSPRGGGGGASMRGVALLEKPLVPDNADRSARLKLLDDTLLMAMTDSFYCARCPMHRSLVHAKSIGHQGVLSSRLLRKAE
jgi:hypothetical protein